MNLPRVTYSNIAADFAPLHAYLDEALPKFKASQLGKSWPNRLGAKSDDAGKTYPAFSPVDNRLVLGNFTEASPLSVERAVDAALAAYADWSARSWKERLVIFRRLVEIMDQRKYELGMACLLEVGKSRLEAIGEAEECVDMLRHYCDEMERHEGFVRPMHRAFPNEETLDVLRPQGVFAVISPFNFPTALSVNMLTGAILTGNCAVYKPSPMAGLTGALLNDAYLEAGVPPGVINLICGGEAVGRALVNDPRIAGVAFTGSHRVGMEIHRAFANGRYARPVIAEMGGKNPAYVAASADLDAAVTGVMRSAFGLQGQKCSACSKAYVANAVMESFLEKLVAATQKIVIGNPERKEVYLGPVIDARAVARYEAASMAARKDGKIIYGGERLVEGELANGFFVAPTIVAGLSAAHSIHKDELFLPFLAVQGFDDLGQAIADGNAVDFGLTAGVYTASAQELELFFAKAEAGVLYANRASGATTGAWPGIQSFAGWKGSGISGKGGLGPHYLQQFMREQSRTVWR
jgi:1-pyrroline-5-carboxylate dehydrogenase